MCENLEERRLKTRTAAPATAARLLTFEQDNKQREVFEHVNEREVLFKLDLREGAVCLRA